MNEREDNSSTWSIVIGGTILLVIIFLVFSALGGCTLAVNKPFCREEAQVIDDAQDTQIKEDFKLPLVGEL